MNENVKKVVKMIIYYVIACYEKQDIQQCRDAINLQYDMVSNGGKDEYLDSMIYVLPEKHIVRSLYEEISEKGIEEMISAYKMAVDIFSKAEETDLSKIEDDEEVERLAEGLMNL
mgnify:CR=1 FL=1